MKKLLTLTVFVLTVCTVAAQQPDKTRMERERQEIQQEIRELQSSLGKVKGQKKETLAKLALLQRKLELQDRLIGNINKEIRIINDDIYLSTLEINRLQRELDTLKSQYARSVVYAYKNKSSYDFLNFIFSANSFNDALKRASYLKSYRSYRQQQVASIVETQRQITGKKQQLLGKQSQKKSVLQNQQEQMAALAEQKKEKDAVVSKLKSQEKDLARQVDNKRKRDRQLKAQIAAVVKRELAEAKRRADAEAAARRKADAEAAAEAKRNAAANNSSSTPKSETGTVTSKPAAKKVYTDLNAADVALSNNFAGNKGRLPWPVDNGVVSIPFGPYTIPGTNLKDNNPCITISTPSVGSPVKSVFDGEVSGVTNTGGVWTVMIRHGKYFCVYTNLGSISVGKGDNVRTGQTIGKVAASDDDSGGELEFYIYNEATNVNPQPWLRR